MKRILFLSKVTVDQHPQAIADSWWREPGNDIMTFSVRTMRNNYNSDQKTISVLLDMIEGFKPDMILGWAPALEAIHHKEWQVFKHRTRNLNTVYWSIDDPFKIETYKNDQKEWAGCFNYVATCDRSDATYAYYMGAGVKKVIFAVPAAAKFLLDSAKATINKAESGRPRVVVYANNSYERAPYKADNVLGRIQILNRIHPLTRGDAVDIYGNVPFQEEVKTMVKHTVTKLKGVISYRKLLNLSGSIVLNPHVRPNADYLNARFFECCAIGCPQIVEDKPCIREFLTEVEKQGYNTSHFKQSLYKPGDYDDFYRALNYMLSLSEPEYIEAVECCIAMGKRWTGLNFINKIIQDIGSNQDKCFDCMERR